MKPVLLTDMKMEASSEEGIRYEKSSTSSLPFQWWELFIIAIYLNVHKYWSRVNTVKAKINHTQTL